MDARESTRYGSSEPLGMTVGPNSYTGSLPNSSIVSPNSTPGLMQNMRLPFNSVINSVSRASDLSNSTYHGEDGGLGLRACGFNVSEPLKRKRGRPRKYGPDGNMTLALAPLSSMDPTHYKNQLSEPLNKRTRGRPPGSGKKQQLGALGGAGLAFTPHVITVKAGEDVASKIMDFSQQGPRTVCILSANGAICNVSLRQSATSGGTLMHEGRYEIISLSGSFLFTENDGSRSRTGGLNVSLAGSDGKVIGGGVAGMLMAASPVQVIVGSFIAEGKKPKPYPLMKHDPSSAPSQMVGLGAPVATSSPPSQRTSSESSDEPSSSFNHGSGICNTGESIQSMSAFSPIGWGSLHSTNSHRHDADMRAPPN